MTHPYALQLTHSLADTRPRAVPRMWGVVPHLLVLVVVEVTDVTFAIDSIPAVFGVTRDTFIVYTSNVFAILGLRALYFLLAGVVETSSTNRLREIRPSFTP